MNNVYIISGVTIGVVILIFLFGYLKYKKIDIAGWFKNAETVLKNIEDVSSALKGYSTGKTSAALNFSELIAKIALKFVQGVEQLYLSGQLTAEGRKDTAVKGVEDFLTSQGIKVTNELKNVISLAVEDAVKESDSTDINAKIYKLVQEKIVPLQKEKDAIQSNLTIATNENSTLKSQVSTLQGKLSTIQNTVDAKNTAPVNVTVSEQK
jgi:chaperonin cofactor prefoldin